MKKFLCVALCLFVFAFSQAREIIRIENPTDELRKSLFSRGFDVAASHPDYIDIVVTDSDKEFISALNLDFETVITEQQALGNLGGNRDGYMTYEEIYDEMILWQTLYPEYVKIYDIGDSRGKIYYENGNDNYEHYQHEIYALKISDNVETSEDEPRILFDGTHHAREPISTEVVMSIIKYLMDNFQVDEDVMSLVEDFEIWCVPLVNPNGHKIVIDPEDTPQDLWWRKNIRDNDGNGYITTSSGQSYPDGVDPNRNYDWHWGTTGISHNPNEHLYCGPEIFSEPEIQGLRDLMIEQRFQIELSYHSYSELVLYPWGYAENTYAADNEPLRDLAVEIASRIPKLNGNGFYTPDISWGLYAASGVTDDYAYGELGIFSFTVEIGEEFIPPVNQVQGICGDHLEGALYTFERLRKSLLTGNITDSNFNPLEANVEILDYDDEGAFMKPRTSNPEFGRYYRLLMPGDYTVIYSKEGYADFEADVTITETGITQQDVILYPVPLTSIEIQMEDVEGNPLNGAEIVFIGSELGTFVADEYGVVEVDSIYYGDYKIHISQVDEPISINTFTIEADNQIIEIGLEVPDFFDGFEAGIDNWVQDFDWGQTTDSYEGTYSLTDSPIGNYSNLESAVFRTDNAFEMLSEEGVFVTFYAKYAIEDGFDYCHLQVSENLWQWESLISFTGSQPNWQKYLVDLSSYSGQTLYFRFNLESDTYEIDDGIYIDNFAIYQNGVNAISDSKTIGNKKHAALHNYPNPFNPETVIGFDIAGSARDVSLEIFNIKGQLVRSWELGSMEAGTQSVVWDGTNSHGEQSASGIYFYRLNIDGESMQSKKMVLMK